MIQKGLDHLRYGLWVVNGARVKHERWIASLRHSDTASFVNGNNALLILDLANGQLRPQYKILRDQGHRVYGVDTVNLPKRGWRDCAYRIARRFYAKDVSANYSKRDDTLICGDVSSLPFRNQSFDLVTSVAAFEHFLDVPSVLQEVHRVLRPGGLIWVLVHLFSCPSGGHNVCLSQVPLRSIPHGIEPWDHLRKRHLPFHVPLNEWRSEQYLSEVEKSFELLKHYCAMREGEHILTQQIENELCKYSRDELTCGAYIILARKSL